MMYRFFRRVMRHKTAIITGLLRLVTHVGLLLLFIGLMSVTNWPLRGPSRTLATTLVTYGAASAAMISVYGGFTPGKKRNRALIASLMLSTVFTDLVAYLQLQIMNVNENNKAQLELFGTDFLWLFLCLVCQFILIFCMVKLTNHYYFRRTPPKSGLLVIADRSQARLMQHKLLPEGQRVEITQTVCYDDPQLDEIIREHEVVVVSNGLPGSERTAILRMCYDLRRDVYCKAELQDIMLIGARHLIVDDEAFLHVEHNRMSLEQRILKRLMDIIVSSAVLLLLSPLLLIVSLLILVKDGKPVLFRQKRLTLDGRKFTILKFRTMRNQTEKDRHVPARKDDQRITSTGHFLRRYRIDELPQFLNVLKGDMTLVGPRPEMLDNVMKYKELMPEFAYREKMKAGITGYAQIEGKYNTLPEDKLMLDLMYIENFSLREDLKLLLRTAMVLFKPDSTEGFTPENDLEEDVP